MNKLPVLIAVAHSGIQVPVELQDRMQINLTDIFDDSDALADRVFDLGDQVVDVILAPAARVCVDVDRAIDDLPPANPDGVFKSLTRKRKEVYRKGEQPDRALSQTLLTSFYEPFHELIGEAVQDPDVKWGFDCHTISAYGPALSDAPGKRPLICLGNWYDQTCDHPSIEWLASCFCAVFELNDSDVQINKPFSGGYITRTFGYNPVPWIQIMLNQSLYLDRDWLANKNPHYDEKRLADIKQKFLLTLQMFFA